MDAREIIEALGGREAVAEATGAKVSSVVSWEWRGFIPTSKVMAAARLAKLRPGCGITEQTLLALAAQPAPRRPTRVHDTDNGRQRTHLLGAV